MKIKDDMGERAPIFLSADKIREVRGLTAEMKLKWLGEANEFLRAAQKPKNG